jgi:putative DNA primase/helicase
MVARAMEPGCLYRYVVILEGPEETGKSTLVRALAGDGWYVELSMGLETKEAHMMLQGAWVAELPELDSLSRTEETRLKAFITMKEDAWIPKYSNFRISTPRRTIFVGTTNDESYLKGQTGNTRFLPIRTGMITVANLHAIREQLFAEAFYVYQQAPHTWWQLPPDALAQAQVEREHRRVINVYEDRLADFLEGRRETTWQEIAQGMLALDTAGWKDKSLQMQIASALKTLGWSSKVLREGDKTRRVWQAKTEGRL